MPTPTTPVPVPTTSTIPTPTVVTSTRRRAARVVPSTRVAYTRHATAGGDKDDRIIAHALNVFYKIMVWGGGIAIFGWTLFGGFNWGRAVTPVGSAPASQVIYVSASVPAPVAQPVPVQPSAPSWSSREECERKFWLILRQDPAGRCN